MNKPKLDYLIIIQARLESTRLPNKVMQMVGNKTMLRHVWDAAKSTGYKTVVAWPERYPNLDPMNVFERFRRISNEFPSMNIVRLTSDCPLLSTNDIINAIKSYESMSPAYYSNHRDGNDVQVFSRAFLMSNIHTSKEHVVADFTTLPTGLSVNTKEDLERVRRIVNAR